jgi:hypothetical protein
LIPSGANPSRTELAPHQGVEQASVAEHLL